MNTELLLAKSHSTGHREPTLKLVQGKQIKKVLKTLGNTILGFIVIAFFG